MYKQTGTGWMRHIGFLLADMAAFEAAFAAALLLRFQFSGDWSGGLYFRVAILLAILNCCVAFFDESYTGISRRGYLKEAKAVAGHVALVAGLLLLYLYLTKQTELSRMFFVYLVAGSLLFVWAFRSVFKAVRQKRRALPSGNRYRLLLAVNRENAARVVRNLKQSECEIAGLCFVDADRVGETVDGIPVVASLDTMLDYIKGNVVDGLFLGLRDEQKLPPLIINTCLSMGTSVHVGLVAPGLDDGLRVVEPMGEYTVLTRSVRIATARQLFIKRAVDICAGLAGMVVTGIACLVVGPMIYRASPGPIFFSQTRVDKNGRKFKIYKFRSMYMDAEERKKELMAQNKIADGLMFKMDDDPRIIKGIGHFIRDCSIDELPQLWNVLKGEMSLIGTRPPTVEEYEKYDYHHKIRLAIKPGITGMWQVSGRSNITDFEEVVKLDASYITNWTLGLDFKILLKTVKVVLRREGAV